MNQINIIACGETARNWNGQGFSIGVNDGLRFHKTDYLICINAPSKFTQERREFIVHHPGKFFAHTNSWREFRPDMELITVVSFTSGQILKDRLYHSRTSPFTAMSMAFNLGAKEIILWGVDFKTHRYYYPGSGDLKAEIHAYEFFIEALERKGTKVYLGCEGSELKLPVYGKRNAI